VTQLFHCQPRPLSPLRARIAAIGSGLALAFAASNASAQTTGWAVDRVEVAPAGDLYFFQTHFPRFIDRAASLSFGAVTTYAYRPLVASVASASGTEQVDAIQHSVATHFQINLQLAQRLGIDLALPVYWLQSGVQDAALPVRAPIGVSAGDLRLGVRVRLLGRADRDPASLAIAATGSFGFIPTAGGAQTNSDGAFRARVFAVGAGSAGPFRWSLSAGVNARPGIELASVRVGSEMFALAGAGLAVMQSRIFFGLETELATALATPFSTGTNHAQVWAMVRASLLDNALQIGAGAGPGLSQAPGTPTVGAFFSLAYTVPIGPAPVRPAATRVVRTEIVGAQTNAPGRPASRCADARHDAPPQQQQPIGDGCPDTTDVLPTSPSLTPRDASSGSPASEAPIAASVPPGAEQGFCDVPSADGCSTGDQDHDGILEPLDACATEAQGLHPDPTRPGCPDADGDGDGVYDHSDLCPTQSHGTAPDPDRRGCPLPDADADRIPDAIDHCPNIPGAPHPDPTLNGCPGLVRLEANSVEILQPIFFATNRDVIQPRSAPVLQAVANALLARTDIRYLLIEGHTDDQGNDELNVDLSQRRAAAVVRWLIEHGISPARLHSRGLGSHQPRIAITPGMRRREVRDARARNRRVEFEILDDAASAVRAESSPAPGGTR
jgi:outer membrane protein OmpA-like peptidoglycan-associated protein